MTIRIFKKLFLLLLIASQFYTAEAQVIIENRENETAFTDTAKAKKSAPWFVKRFTVSAGLFALFSNTNMSASYLDGTSGTDINFEKDLGFATMTKSFYGEAQWRASRRSRFTLAYHSFYRTADKMLTKEVVFKNRTYPLEAPTHAYFNADVFHLSYGYAIISNSRYEMGLLAGVHILKLRVGLAVDATVKVNNALATAHFADHFNFTTPLPDLGIWGGLSISRNWALNGAVSYFSLTVNNVYGSVFNGLLGLTYTPLQNLNVNVAYNGFVVKSNIERDDWKGNYRGGYQGPMLTVSYSFGNNPWK
ncbi:hypothetical protein [Taibaiella soli]|uniref:DUF4421 domain-containing protein n=1 Tax=Taibaiella soli TaxID=1649169 RepID=A0A2W2AKZ8_9BACT|nr:hypothetical protein [Taibaiella soli]PZF74252.1 hypothetical protein DN068_04355 [Taibaiella soli]